MTSHVARLYSLALALFVFFLVWATIGARPWAASGARKDPAAHRPGRPRAAPPARGRRGARRLVRHRWAVCRVQLRKRQSQIASARKAQLAAAAPAARRPDREPAAA